MEEPVPTPSSVVAAFAQTFVEGRKVVVFGDCTSGLAERLVERGARLVHVYDSDLTRVAEAAARGTTNNIAYAPLGQSGVAVRDGAFDVGIIENLALVDDAAALMRRLRRALAARGVAFVITPNTDVDPILLPGVEQSDSAPSYYDLYEIVSREFDEVRMVGQTPFVGYALADFTPGVPDEFSIDTGFVKGGAEEPEWYIAVASHFPVTIDPYHVVQLQATGVIEASAPRDSRELEVANETIAQLQKKLTKGRSDGSERELLVRTKAELDKRDAWVAELESRAAAADARADAAEDKAEAAKKRSTFDRAEAERASARIAELEASLTSAEQRAKDLVSQLERADKRESEVQRRLAAATDELRAMEGAPREDSARDPEELARLESKLEGMRADNDRLKAELSTAVDERAALEDDIDRAEAQLRDRAGVIAQLNRDISRLSALAARLLVDLESAKEADRAPAPTNGDAAPIGGGIGVDSSGPSLEELQANLDELAQVDARRIADLTAAQWTVAELEGKLADQEQQARAELEQLRAELQQKMTLLHQLQNAPPR
jgi:hypothetical protein